MSHYQAAGLSWTVKMLPWGGVYLTATDRWAYYTRGYFLARGRGDIQVRSMESEPFDNESRLKIIGIGKLDD